MGVDFLDFLRSGEKDIHAFAESRHGRKCRSQVSPPTALPLAKPLRTLVRRDRPVADGMKNCSGLSDSAQNLARAVPTEGFASIPAQYWSSESGMMRHALVPHGADAFAAHVRAFTRNPFIAS
jgi:hypothetical protein